MSGPPRLSSKVKINVAKMPLPAHIELRDPAACTAVDDDDTRYPRVSIGGQPVEIGSPDRSDLSRQMGRSLPSTEAIQSIVLTELPASTNPRSGRGSS